MNTPPDLYTIARRLIAEGWPVLLAWQVACARCDYYWRTRP